MLLKANTLMAYCYNDLFTGWFVPLNAKMGKFLPMNSAPAIR